MTTVKHLVKNAVYPVADYSRFESADILLEESDGRFTILKIARKQKDPEADVVYASGALFMPGFIDLWARVGEPGRLSREDYISGSNAAVYGGYGHVLLEPFGDQICDDVRVLQKRLSDSQKSTKCKYHFTAALTKGCKGKELCDYSELSECGAVAFTDGKFDAMDDAILYKAMNAVRDTGRSIIVMPRHEPCYHNAVATSGRIADLLKYPGIPSSVEAASISRYLIFALDTGCRIHVVGVSTKHSVELIAEAKSRGANVTASAFPIHFSMNENDLPFYGSLAKVWPPLRAKEDVDSLISGIKDGTVDCIVSDHTPLLQDEKSYDFISSESGTIGLQTAFSAACSYLLYPGHIDYIRLAKLFICSPAEILGIDIPRVAEGESGDFSVISINDDFIVTENYLKSKAHNSVYNGLSLCGLQKKAYFSDKR